MLHRKIFPGYLPLACYILGVIFFRTISAAEPVKPEKEIYYLQRIQESPQRIDAYLELAKWYQDSHDFDRAISILSQSTTQNSDNPVGYTALGEMYVELKQYDKAIHSYRRAAALAPTDAAPIYGVLTTYYLSGRIDEMIDYATQAVMKVSNPDQIISIWDQVGDVFYHGGNAVKFINLYDTVNKTISDTSTREYMQTSLYDYGHERLDDIIPIFESRYKSNPKDIDSITVLAEIYSQIKQPDKAQSFYEQLCRLQPENSQALDALSAIYQTQGEDNKNLKLCQTALVKNRKNADTYTRLAKVYYRLGRKAQCDELIAQVNQKFPNEPAALQSLAWFYRDTNQPEMAIQRLKQLIAISPDKIVPEQTLIRYYLDLCRYSDAERDLEFLLSSLSGNLSEQQIKSSYDLAFAVYAKQNKIDKVIAVYQQSLTFFLEETTRVSLRQSIEQTCQKYGRISKLIDTLKQQIREHPTDTNRLQLFTAACTHGRFLETLSAFEQLYLQDPDNLTYATQLLNLYKQTNNWKKVIDLGNRLIEQYPNQSWRFPQLIKAYTQTSQPELAEQMINEIKNQLPDREQLWITLASIYENLNQPAEAIGYYEKLLTVNAQNVQNYIKLSQLYQQVGNDTASLSMALKVKELGAYRWDLSNAERIIVAHELRTGNWKSALTELNDWKFVPPYLSWTQREAIQPLITELFRQHQSQLAWELIKKYYCYQSSNMLDEWSLPILDYRSNQFISQLPELQKYLELEVKRGVKDRCVYIFLAEKYYQQNRTNNQLNLIIPVYEQAIRVFLKEPEPLILLADSYIENRQIEPVLKYSIQALSILTAKGFPGDNPECMHACSFCKTLNLESATQCVYCGHWFGPYLYNDDNRKRVVQFNPYKLMLRVAGIYRYQNQSDKMNAIINELENNKHKTGDIWYALGTYYERTVGLDSAVQAYQRAVSFYARDSQIWFDILRCNLALHNYPVAEENVTQLTELVDRPWMVVELYRQIANLYDTEQLYEQEIELYFKMVKLNAQSYSWRNVSDDLLGWQQNKQRLEKFATILENKLKSDPKNLNIASLLGDIYHRLGKTPVLP